MSLKHSGLTPDADRPGRKKLAPNQAAQISQRLRAFILKRHPSIQAFVRRQGWVQQTVSRWFGRRPRTPDVLPLARLAEEENLNLNWLLLGKGPTLRDPGEPVDRLDTRLRQLLVAELTSRARATDTQLRAIVPEAEEVLERLVCEYVNRVRGFRRRTARAFIEMSSPRVAKLVAPRSAHWSGEAQREGPMGAVLREAFGERRPRSRIGDVREDG